jgi:hypothetical protein
MVSIARHAVIDVRALQPAPPADFVERVPASHGLVLDPTWYPAHLSPSWFISPEAAALGCALCAACSDTIHNELYDVTAIEVEVANV